MGRVGGLERGPERKWEGHMLQWANPESEGPTAFTAGGSKPAHVTSSSQVACLKPSPEKWRG